MSLFEKFQAESNLIENISSVRKTEVEALQLFCDIEPTIETLTAYAKVCQPGILLRDKVGLDVRIGNYIPLRGGSIVPTELQAILDAIKEGGLDAFQGHVAFEKLHPFTDGNGRSGRALWLYQMLWLERKRNWVDRFGFLRSFYYQTLAHS